MAHDLVCANCAGPVMEGRCSVCRAARDELASQAFPVWVLLALLTLAAAVSLALTLRS